MLFDLVRQVGTPKFLEYTYLTFYRTESNNEMDQKQKSLTKSGIFIVYVSSPILGDIVQFKLHPTNC